MSTLYPELTRGKAAGLKCRLLSVSDVGGLQPQLIPSSLQNLQLKFHLLCLTGRHVSLIAYIPTAYGATTYLMLHKLGQMD